MDVIIESIEIENFVSIESANLELGGDIFFITGENRDELSSASNGAGKSLFLQAIGWALFEETPRKGLLKDDVIGPFKSFCRVSVTISKGGQTITIDRTRKHPEKGSGASIYIEGSEDLSRHSKVDTDKFIEEILGINPKIFYYCVYADNDKEPLVALTSAKLNAVVSEILNTQRFDLYLTKIRKLKKEKTKEHGDASLARDYSLRQLKDCESDISDYETQLSQWEGEREAKLNKYKKALEESESEKKEFEELLAGREGKLEEYEIAKKEIEVVEALNATLADLQKKKKTVEKRKEAALTKVRKAEVELDKSEEAYDNIFNNVSGACQYCGNSLHASGALSAHAETFGQRRDDAKANLIEAQVDLESIEIPLKEVSDEVSAIEAALEENRELIKKVQKIERALDAFKQVASSVEYCEKEAKKIKKEITELKNSSPLAISQNLEKQERRKKELKKESEALTATILERELEVQACQVLEDHISSTKAGLFNSFIVELQERINANFQEMTEGDYDCSFEQRNEELMMVFTNTSKNGKYYPYWIFSRGERIKMAKAASFALNEMMQIGLIIDDEGIEGVDDAGGASLLDFIIEKSNDKSLFFVSHKDSVKDYFKGYNNVHIVKENGRSSLTMKRIGENE